MIVLVLTAIGVASALYNRRRLARLAQLRLEGLWLVWVAFVSQILLFEVIGYFIPVRVTNVLHLVTYGLCLAFLWRNRRIPGGWIITAGASANLAAIVANGGTMPANIDAWRRAGLPAPTEFENSSIVADPKLAFLGDIFSIPASWPLSNVFSIGDVLIVIGGTYLAHRWCHSTEEASDDRPTRPFQPFGPIEVASRSSAHSGAVTSEAGTAEDAGEAIRLEMLRVAEIVDASHRESELLRQSALSEVDRTRDVLVQLLAEIQGQAVEVADLQARNRTDRFEAIERQLSLNAQAIQRCTDNQNELARVMADLLETVTNSDGRVGV